MLRNTGTTGNWASPGDGDRSTNLDRSPSQHNLHMLRFRQVAEQPEGCPTKSSRHEFTWDQVLVRLSWGQGHSARGRQVFQ